MSLDGVLATLEESVAKNEQQSPEKLKALEVLIEKAWKQIYVKPVWDLTSFIPITSVRRLGFVATVSQIRKDKQFVIDGVKRYLISQVPLIGKLQTEFGQIEGEYDYDNDDHVNEHKVMKKTDQILRYTKRLALYKLLETNSPKHIAQSLPDVYSMPVKKEVQWYQQLIKSLQTMVEEAQAEAHAGGGAKKADDNDIKKKMENNNIEGRGK